jgi:uncharacterized damage-inducible protein DinB
MDSVNAALDDLHHYLRNARSSVLWKLEGLSEYEARRPMVGTATNVLGLIKHLTGVELLYFGVIFGRFPSEMPIWFGEQMPPNADMWAQSDESVEAIIGDYLSACAHADSTITTADPAAQASAPWLSEHPMSLHRVMVHVLAETERHAGHADVVRELIDGAVGRLPGNEQMLPGAAEDDRDATWWRNYLEEVEAAARVAANRSDSTSSF